MKLSFEPVKLQVDMKVGVDNFNIANKYSTARDMLKDLVKVIQPSGSTGVMREADRHMEGKSVEDFPDVVQGCMKEDLPYVIGISMQIVPPLHLFYDDRLKGSALWKDIVKHFVRATHETGGPGLILFRVKRLGTWLAHNMTLEKSTAVHLVIRPSNAMADTITIMPVINWKRKEKSND